MKQENAVMNSGRKVRSQPDIATSNTFWDTLPKPFFVLAPMANVTDVVFRSLFAKYGKPDVTWTEFVSADGLLSAGKDKLLVDLRFSNKERPIIAQLFTGNPKAMREAATLVKKLKFDGLDINMGCPDRAVEKQGGGAAMIKDFTNAKQVIEAAREGAGTIPVSVKTRIGYNSVDLRWIESLLELKLPALTVHLRTRKEMSEVPAHWELMPDIIELRDKISPHTLIIGNGDVESIEDGAAKMKKYGGDGVMIGRGIFGRPWLFESLNKKGKRTIANATEKTPAERMAILLEHTKLFQKTFLPKKSERLKNFATMKKHFKAYISGWDNAKELRAKLMETENAKEVEEILKSHTV